MDIITISLSLVAGLVAVYVLGRALGLMKAAHPPLPPGPKGLPIIGNLMDLPKEGNLEAHHWLKHKYLYGPISSITVMGQTMIIINDAKIALELLEKRAVKHSSRAKQMFIGEMVGWENSMGLFPYSNKLRAYRKTMSRVIGTKAAAAQFNSLQEAQVSHFLRHILEAPEKLVNHIRKETGAIILQLTYGYTIESHENDPLVDIIAAAMDKLGRAAVPGTFMVDLFPFLKRLPEWFPGTGFKETARQMGAELNVVVEKPYAFTKHQIYHEKNKTSFISRLLEAGDPNPEEEFFNKWSAMTMYAAGADTTVSAIASFFLAMTVYPEVQKTAQDEIDRIVGQSRLPTVADRVNLPYVEATLKELLRWNPVAPMSLPHMSSEDDTYEGYFIPKGSMLLPNIWHFTHDPDVYSDPMCFKPERFLMRDGHKPEPDPLMFVFGFGRRVCPGKYLADNNLYLNIAQSLAVFDIKKSMENGSEVAPALKFEPGLISHPAPFKNIIKPRSPQHENMIRSTSDTYPWEESDAQILESIEY